MKVAPSYIIYEKLVWKVLYKGEKASWNMDIYMSVNACKSYGRKLTKLKSDILWKEMGWGFPPKRKVHFVLNVLFHGKDLNNEKIYMLLVIFINQVFFKNMEI